MTPQDTIMKQGAGLRQTASGIDVSFVYLDDKAQCQTAQQVRVRLKIGKGYI